MALNISIQIQAETFEAAAVMLASVRQRCQAAHNAVPHVESMVFFEGTQSPGDMTAGTFDSCQVVVNKILVAPAQP